MKTSLLSALSVIYKYYKYLLPSDKNHLHLPNDKNGSI
nr:MAG TPA: hypothetical protein [Caudoviricetes sp.]